MKKTLSFSFFLAFLPVFLVSFIPLKYPAKKLQSAFSEIKIGKQIWMAENLNVDHFRNGELIPEAKTDEEWEKAFEGGTPAWCYYENDTANGEKYGKLYNWFAVVDERGLAPNGWHIPSEKEFVELITFLGGNFKAGKPMKSTTGWQNDGSGTNKSGFNGLPAGYRYFQFQQLGQSCCWWSNSEINNKGVYCLLDYRFPNAVMKSDQKGIGFPVRCVKDNNPGK